MGFKAQKEWEEWGCWIQSKLFGLITVHELDEIKLKEALFFIINLLILI